MSLKTYKAYTMAEALAAVKRDLGADAVILSTRSSRRGGFLGMGRKSVVEVTATTGQQARGGAAASARAMAADEAAGLRGKPKVHAAMLAYAAQKKKAPSATVELPVGGGESARDSLNTNRLAEALLEQRRRLEADLQAPLVAEDEGAGEMTAPPAKQAVVRRPGLNRGSRNSGFARAAERPAPIPMQAEGGYSEDQGQKDAAVPVAERFILTPAQGGINVERAAEADESQPEEIVEDQRPASEARHQPADRRPERRATIELFDEPIDGDEPESGPGETDEMRDELSAIRQMVGQVLQRQTGSPGGMTPTMPQKLFDMYLKLIGQEVSEELADRIINNVRDELNAFELEDETKLRAAMVRHLADYIPTADHAVPERSPDRRPLTIALVGPTGVGKTTTLAKLAASYKLRHRKRVGLITADTYRIAAVDQLRTYANIIGLPLKVVLTPGEMRQAIHGMRDCDVILIDTAGRSQNDTGRIGELKEIIDAAEPHEVHLVLSGTAGEKVLLKEAEAFGEVGVEKVVLTKLDEAVSFGMLVNVLRQIDKKLSFFTTGQEVPDHLEIGRPDRLAELVMGEQLNR